MRSKLYPSSRSCDVGYDTYCTPWLPREGGILLMVTKTKCIYSKICDICNQVGRLRHWNLGYFSEDSLLG